LSLVVERSPDVPRHARADEIKLRQILVNLIGNAIKFTKEGGVTVRVGAVRALPSKKAHRDAPLQLHFKIKDTGQGIAPEDAAVLFDPFVQTETGRRSQEGTGLGLAISREFVQLMDGDIRVRSEVGKGSEFVFDIRVHLIDGESIESPPVSREVIGIEPGQFRYNILIVDDNPDSRKLLYKLLEPFGFQLREAENGREAVEIWREWAPDLIWMDIHMPVMNGYEAVKTIRNYELEMPSNEKGLHSGIRKCNIIAQTASSFEEERSVILEAGCDDFLRKPFTDDEVFEMLHKHLGVCFIYAEEKQLTIEKVLSPQSLAALPAEWLTTLQKGAHQADFVLLTNVIKQIREHDAVLADALARLAENFEYDEILALLQKSD